MGKKRYTLYLDESRTTQAHQGTPFFSMAGIVIMDKHYPVIQTEIDVLKQKTWGDLPHYKDIILHQMNISNAAKDKLDFVKYPEYERFKSKPFRREFNRNLANIYDCKKITIIGSSINESYLKKCFEVSVVQEGNRIYRNVPDEKLIALQLLLENYCQFLCEHNGLGKVIYESVGDIQDEALRCRFYNIKLMGSMYITQDAMANHLLGIDFIPKSQNNEGLQIADFVPNAFARDHAGFCQIDRDEILFNKMKYYRYDGMVARDKDRYGVKYLP